MVANDDAVRRASDYANPILNTHLSRDRIKERIANAEKLFISEGVYDHVQNRLLVVVKYSTNILMTMNFAHSMGANKCECLYREISDCHKSRSLFCDAWQAIVPLFTNKTSDKIEAEEFFIESGYAARIIIDIKRMDRADLNCIYFELNGDPWFNCQLSHFYKLLILDITKRHAKAFGMPLGKVLIK
jgi:hypothetical protein